MYKRRDRQINFDDFNQPLGLELDLENRWVKKAMLIPCDEIEKRYSGLFSSKEGNVAKPARLALGSILLQREYNFSDEETAAMIRENPYLQYLDTLLTKVRMSQELVIGCGSYFHCIFKQSVKHHFRFFISSADMPET